MPVRAHDHDIAVMAHPPRRHDKRGPAMTHRRMKVTARTMMIIAAARAEFLARLRLRNGQRCENQHRGERGRDK